MRARGCRGEGGRRRRPGFEFGFLLTRRFVRNCSGVCHFRLSEIRALFRPASSWSDGGGGGTWRRAPMRGTRLSGRRVVARPFGCRFGAGGGGGGGRGYAGSASHGRAELAVREPVSAGGTSVIWRAELRPRWGARLGVVCCSGCSSLPPPSKQVESELQPKRGHEWLHALAGGRVW